MLPFPAGRAAECPELSGLCCKTRKYRLNKILAKVSSPPALVRDTVLKQMGGPLSESVEVDVVRGVRKHRTLQRPLESRLFRCERVLQQISAISGPSHARRRRRATSAHSAQTHRAHSGNPAFRSPSINSFACDRLHRPILADIVKAGSTSSRLAAASRASTSRPRWAKADARQR